MVKSLISGADEASSLDHVVSVIKGWGGEVFVNGMDFEPFERVYWSDGVLPDVSDNIIESIGFEHVYWIRGKPVLQVNISHFLVFPGVQVLI